jgi:hypothetical protein
MRTRIASLALVAAAFAAPAAPAVADGPCDGTYDTNCYMFVCSRTTCLELRCAVYTDVAPGPQNGCFG